MTSELPACIHRSGEVSPGMIHCVCNRFARSPADRSAEVCKACPFINRPNYGHRFLDGTQAIPRSELFPCIHRGDVVRQGEADLCGRKGTTFDVFACDIHGECVIGTFCKQQAERNCLKCSDRKEPVENNLLVKSDQPDEHIRGGQAGH